MVATKFVATKPSPYARDSKRAFFMSEVGFTLVSESHVSHDTIYYVCYLHVLNKAGKNEEAPIM